MSILIPPPQNGQNAIVLWHEALNKAVSKNDYEIIFSPCRYDFYPESCTQSYRYFTNNDEGVKTIAMDLNKIDNLILNGQNAELIFHGRISPLVATEVTDITIQNFTIDFEDNFVSDADIIEIENDICWIKIRGNHRFNNGRIHFIDDFYDNLSGKLQIFSYDSTKKEVIYDSSTVTVLNENLLEKNGLIGIRNLNDKVKSNALIIKHELRLAPGLVFDKCKDIKIKNVNLHHASGMGILAQLCTDIALEEVNITPRNRRVSVSDDAVHFADCRGKLSVNKCHLAGTLDDSFNAHGIYRPLKLRIPGGKFFYLDSGHFQQQGLQGTFAGDTLELAKNDTAKPYGTIKIKNARSLNKSLTLVEFDEKELPCEWTPGDCAAVIECLNAEITITNSFFAPLNGRGILASGSKKVIIRNNRFHTSGAAVFVSGDTDFWYESGPVQSMIIENNIFDNCCYKNNASTREVIAIYPDLHKFEDNFFYHGEINIFNNCFKSTRRPLVSMQSVKKAELTQNIFEEDNVYTFKTSSVSAYSFAKIDSPWAIFRHCGEVINSDNKNMDLIGKTGDKNA